jgi:hypothetical protein
MNQQLLLAGWEAHIHVAGILRYSNTFESPGADRDSWQAHIQVARSYSTYNSTVNME